MNYAWIGAALAEERILSGEESRRHFIGNTLVSQRDGKITSRFFVAADGSTIYDPVRSFQLKGGWSVDDEAGKFCAWEVTPDRPDCARVSLESGIYTFDWGDGFDRDIRGTTEAGDTTDPSDNPGTDYRPGPSIPLPNDLRFEPPAPDLPADLTPGTAGQDSDPDGDSLTVTGVTTPFQSFPLVTVPISPVALGAGEAGHFMIFGPGGTAELIVGTDGSVSLNGLSGDPFAPLASTDVGVIGFTYTIDDGNGGTDTANALITINGNVGPARPARPQRSIRPRLVTLAR